MQISNRKENLAWLWQNLERILIILFLATFTFNVRKVFLTPYSFLNGGFNEYMTFSLSWAESLIVAVIIIYTIKYIISQIIKFRGIKSLLYIVIRNKSSILRRITPVSRETFLLWLFLGWTGLSIFWAQYQPVAFYRFVFLLAIVSFAFISTRVLQDKKWLRIAIFVLILNALFQSLLGITQFICNSSLGLRILGESILGPNIDGVAKITINSGKHIRAYGTFPHPNIMAGFLIIPLFILIIEYFSRLQKVSRETIMDVRRLQNKVSRETILGGIPLSFLTIFLVIILVGFFLTFSRSAFLGFFVGLMYLLFNFEIFRCPLFLFEKKESRGILKSRYPKNLFHFLSLQKGRNKRVLFYISALIFLFFFISFISKHTSFFSNQSLEERNLYQIVSRETIAKHPVTGIGLGNFVYYEFATRPNFESWQYQPVHNLYLLVFSELGGIGFTIFLSFLISCLSGRKSKKQASYTLTNHIFYCIILSFLILSFFDHYFWDIKSGTLIFMTPFILFPSCFRIKNSKLDKKNLSAIIKKA